MMYEGAPNHPYPNRWWQMIEKYGISILYTSPTAIRGLMRFGEAWPKRHDLSSLRLLGSVGEPINPEAWKWYHKVVGNEQCPIMDTWWQTETGGFMITPLPITPLKPGSATKPFFGNEMAVVDDNGKEVKAGEEGKLVIKEPWPGMARTIYGDAERYKEVYWKDYEKQGWYKEDLENLEQTTATISYPSLTQEQLESLHKKFYTQVVLNPKRLIKRVFRIKHLNEFLSIPIHLRDFIFASFNKMKYVR